MIPFFQIFKTLAVKADLLSRISKRRAKGLCGLCVKSEKEKKKWKKSK